MSPQEEEAGLERAFVAYAEAHPDRVQEFTRRLVEISEANRLPSGERTLAFP